MENKRGAKKRTHKGDDKGRNTKPERAHALRLFAKLTAEEQRIALRVIARLARA